MELIERAIAQLRIVRDMSRQMLTAFETPEQWTHQVAPGTNHALWFAGHMAVCDNWFIKLLDPQRVNPMEEWDPVFSAGSQPTNNPEDYPPVGEVLDAMRERRAVLLEVLQGMSTERLTAPAPEGMPYFVTDMLSLVEGAVWHEAMHLGQVSVVRRALGHTPLFDAAAAEAGQS